MLKKEGKTYVSQIKWGSILSYLSMGLSIIIGLVYTPVMIRLLGQSEYGLYNTVASTISMLSILNLGFNSSYVRYMAKYKHDNDKIGIARLNGLFLVIFMVIGLVVFGCGIYLTHHLDIVFKNGLTVQEYDLAYVLMILMTINLAISFPLSVFTSIISANERFVFQKIVGLLTTIISPALTLPLLLMGYRSIAMISVSFILALISGGINIYYVFFRLNNRFIFHGFDKKLFKDIFRFTIFIAINLIIDQINWNIDKILLGRYKGTIAVAIYSVGYALYGYYMTFSLSISSVFTPRIHRIVNSTLVDIREQRKQLTELFIKVGRIQYLVLALIASGIVFFGKEFIVNIWAGQAYKESYFVALLLIIPASIALIQNLGIEIQRAQNKHQFRSYVYSVMAIINLALSIYLCQLYGAIGSAVGTAISLVFANGIVMNIYYHKKCNIDIVAFWKNILQINKGMFLPLIVGIVIQHYMNLDNIGLYICGIGGYSFIYLISMFLFGMNSYEKDLILKPLKAIYIRK